MKIPKKEEGQGLVEYALLLVLVAVIIIAILTVLGAQVMVVFARVTAGLNGQVVTGVGTEAVVTDYDLQITDNGPTCSATISNISFVGLNNGAPLENGSVTVHFTMGDLHDSTPGTTGANGMGTASGTITFNGSNCGSVRPGQ